MPRTSYTPAAHALVIDLSPIPASDRAQAIELARSIGGRYLPGRRVWHVTAPPSSHPGIDRATVVRRLSRLGADVHRGIDDVHRTVDPRSRSFGQSSRVREGHRY
jgi:hypothetical protein